MKKKKHSVWNEIRYWDWKSIRIGILSILFISVCIYFFSGNAQTDFNKIRAENLNGKVEGEILNIENLDHLNQSRFDANQIETVAYKVTYKYSVYGKNFNQSMLLNSSQNETLNLLDRVSKGENAVDVKYDKSNPIKSVLQLN